MSKLAFAFALFFSTIAFASFAQQNSPPARPLTNAQSFENQRAELARFKRLTSRFEAARDEFDWQNIVLLGDTLTTLMKMEVEQAEAIASLSEVSNTILKEQKKLLKPLDFKADDYKAPHGCGDKAAYAEKAFNEFMALMESEIRETAKRLAVDSKKMNTNR